MLGELALYCFIILILTGVYLTFFFHPSPTEVIYQGSYAPIAACGYQRPISPHSSSASTSGRGS